MERGIWTETEAGVFAISQHASVPRLVIGSSLIPTAVDLQGPSRRVASQVDHPFEVAPGNETLRRCTLCPEIASSSDVLPASPAQPPLLARLVLGAEPGALTKTAVLRGVAVRLNWRVGFPRAVDIRPPRLKDSRETQSSNPGGRESSLPRLVPSFWRLFLSLIDSDCGKTGEEAFMGGRMPCSCRMGPESKLREIATESRSSSSAPLLED
ncbi:uncharacterized protein BJX67DRAFT_32525 [Aspergillus lucknowensis]|uniref:Uncharacterized protein n=1 Tax=Aspergillus lucknowensis TaxID=176173 RepID=A0ABR4LX39_9EURO